jgi:tungstate transport system substrate-binding protein
MRRFVAVALVLGVITLVASAQNVHLRLATTTSTQDSGLLPILNQPFEKLTGIAVEVISVGSGKAIKLGENGDVDVVLVHDRAAEDMFVAQGFGVNRREVMHNDFVIVGPIEDPARIARSASAAAAFARIASARASFVSRGDESGTNVKERDLWATAKVIPKGTWYKETGQGMGEVLVMSNSLGAYTLTDRGTWLAMKEKLPGLHLLFEGGVGLLNPYEVIAVNPQKHPEVSYLAAMQYIAWVTSVQGQKIIGDYTLGGQRLFIADAVK